MPEGGETEERQPSIWTGISRAVLIFFVVNFISGHIFGQNKQVQQQQTATTDNQEKKPSVVPANNGLVLYPIWPSGTLFDLEMFVSTDSAEFAGEPYVRVEDINIREPSLDVKKSIEVPVDENVVARNASLYAHFVMTRKDQDGKFHEVREISSYMPQKREIKKRNLLEDHGNEPEEEEEPVKIVPHYHPNITFAFVNSNDAVAIGGMHPSVKKYYHEERPLREGDEKGYYYPVLFDNTFWQLDSQFRELNQTGTVSLNFNLYVTPMWKFQMLATMRDAFKQQKESGGANMEEEVKRVLTETNPYLLVLTMAVSALHTLFEFLALKSDVSHWRGRTDKVGVSVRSIVANVVMQLIIMLYLLDNNESTNKTVLFTQGMGILVEAWKITKAVDIKFNQNGKWISITDKHELSETEKRTQEYDEIIFKYMYMAAVPLILAYAVYSLMYKTHKSWYSFVIETLVGSVYAYGFLMLVPSIYINYRLKSVAHMSKKAMTYKFLNTFIDDLFAFVIKMPWLHRLATLRDDIIFFVYLYQTWIYRVDYSRVNELGQAGPEQQANENAKDDDKKNI